uniref:ELM2 domain-containing protein n=1 Tax=Ascaris lumbricoides TaxID=6252 RepID=A0A0M3HFF6_ASCLU
MYLETQLERRSTRVRIGDNYQADLSELKCSDTVESSSYADRDECLWNASSNISDAKLENFLMWTKSQPDIKEDAALYILYRNGYSMDTTIKDVKRLVKKKPSVLDLTIFENDFQQCSNRFDLSKMKVMFPHRSTVRIVDMFCLIKGLTPNILYSIDVLNWNAKWKRDLCKRDQANVVRQLYMARRRRTYVFFQSFAFYLSITSLPAI